MTDLGNCSPRGDPSLERGLILRSDISLIRKTGNDSAAPPACRDLAPTSEPRLSEAAMLQHSTVILQRTHSPVSQHEQGPWHHCHRSVSNLSQRGSGRAGRSELSLQMDPQLRGAAKAPTSSLVPAVPVDTNGLHAVCG